MQINRYSNSEYLIGVVGMRPSAHKLNPTYQVPEEYIRINKPLDASRVMLLLGYNDRSAFWDSVHRNHIPHIRVSRRKIIFEALALNDWIDTRRVGSAQKGSS